MKEEYFKSRGFNKTPTEPTNQIEETNDVDLAYSIIPNIDSNPSQYIESYKTTRQWIQDSIEKYKIELQRILYPLFIHVYITLIHKDLIDQAKQFMDQFKQDHIDMYKTQILILEGIFNSSQISQNESCQRLTGQKMKINLTIYTFELLLSFLQEKKFISLLKIINQHIVNPVDQLDENSEKDHQLLYLGPLPPDTWLVSEIQRAIEEQNKGELIKPFKNMIKLDENSPSRDTVPQLPSKLLNVEEVIESIENKVLSVPLGRESLPSICFYTFHNTYENLNCTTLSSDGSIIAAGFNDSIIRVWNAHIGSQSGNDLYYHSIQAITVKLIGHGGPVYDISMDTKKQYMVSCSEDTTIRLWSLETYSNLVSYKGHNYPVWSVDFATTGLYFASGSYDKTARLWSCDHIYPLRIFAGHDADVTAVKFHPNTNYLLTGSRDNTARLWDLNQGKCVRILKGHHDAVSKICLSPDGKMAATTGDDNKLILWDLASGKSIASSNATHITCLEFSQDNSILSCSSLDGTIKIWDVKTIDNGWPSIKTFYTKSTDVLGVKFSNRNMLYGLGVYR